MNFFKLVQPPLQTETPKHKVLEDSDKASQLLSVKTQKTLRFLHFINGMPELTHVLSDLVAGKNRSIKWQKKPSLSQVIRVSCCLVIQSK